MKCFHCFKFVTALLKGFQFKARLDSKLDYISSYYICQLLSCFPIISKYILLLSRNLHNFFPFCKVSDIAGKENTSTEMITNELGKGIFGITAKLNFICIIKNIASTCVNFDVVTYNSE